MVTSIKLMCPIYSVTIGDKAGIHFIDASSNKVKTSGSQTSVLVIPRAYMGCTSYIDKEVAQILQTRCKDFVMLGAKPQDMTALSIDYVIKI